ncbi:MAG: thioredoxin-dependent thiol peroxidase [Bryobacterales bacterium]|nr:thioredoxin-dependent thiol peroxidase [Bryobacteraceae bacterium]MDW8356164.1 thioredoxin-dependent thiol peroxidase [Bryobacterales bacterium]
MGAAKVELREGDPAPDFELETDAGQRLRLSALRGQTVVLYFYPKAGTPGCTVEACEFRDAMGRSKPDRVVVLGVSPDTPAALARFKAQHRLPFTLLADPDKRAAQAYGVWTEKTLYGRKVMGIERTTFVVGPDGRIQRVYRKVRPQGHAAAVLAALD